MRHETLLILSYTLKKLLEENRIVSLQKLGFDNDSWMSMKGRAITTNINPTSLELKNLLYQKTFSKLVL